ncbi:glycoside hydrolase family 76 protein [Actinoalloteichus spitiensis]|uniref:glycoside hydrolase family 76 protein n=1 Tax=Actinoalloteichus spitiensis TaxID=252394 RepID=UPI00037BD71C|nr:glycoside hydrolase family 76 protein [Actinoalloteichus spitiensis]
MTEELSLTRRRVWAARAEVAERAVRQRHLREVWGLPGTLIGLASWPPSPALRLGIGRWNYWWQAHLLDCLVDAELRAPSRARRTALNRLARGVVLRNLGWTNDYYDDMAWLGLALHRAGAVTGERHRHALRAVEAELHAAWTRHGGGGIWWRRHSRYHDDFKNTPANGPAAILHARLGTETSGHGLERAVAIAEWLEDTLVDPATGLLWDGVRVDYRGGVRRVVRRVYTYCQGVYLGAALELASATGEQRWWLRARRTVDAVATRLVTSSGALRTHGGGDGGLFSGILARYLALAVARLPPGDVGSRALAAELVLASAEAVWRNRRVVGSGPLFPSDWNQPARVPCRPAGLSERTRGGEGAVSPDVIPERDLSVQLGAWMVLEAAASVERSGVVGAG